MAGPMLGLSRDFALVEQLKPLPPKVHIINVVFALAKGRENIIL